MKASRIRLTIDRITVHGLTDDQHGIFSRGLREALLRQLGNASALGDLDGSQRNRVATRLPAPSFTGDLAANAASAVVASLRTKR